MTVNRWASLACTAFQVVELSPIAVNQQNRRPRTGDPVGPLITMDGAELQRRCRHFPHRAKIALAFPLGHRRQPRCRAGSGRIVVVELLFGLLGEEPLKLCAKLVAARQVLVAIQ